MKAPIVGRKRGSQRLKPVPPSMRPKKPVRGKGKVKPPTRERRKPVPFPGSPPRGGGKIQPGRPAKPPRKEKPVPMPATPPRRKKPKKGPLGGTTIGVSMLGKPKKGKIINPKTGKTINPGKIAQRPTAKKDALARTPSRSKGKSFPTGNMFGRMFGRKRK